MDQPRLFRLAVEAIHVQAVFVPGEGWRCGLVARHGDESWEEGPQRAYSHLATPELLDVVSAELERVLGL